MPILIADVSDFQALVNPAAYKSVGVTGIITKVSESNSFATRTHRHNLAASRDAGFHVGAYHFLHLADKGQADWFCDHVEAAWGGYDGLMCMLDVELEAGGKAPQIQDVHDFASRFYQRSNNHPLLIYSGTWYWKGYMDNPQETHGSDLVDARYVGGAGDPRKILEQVTPGYWVPYGGWRNYTLRQYTCSARVPGEPFPVDVSVFWGSDAELRRKAGMVPPPPPWEALPTLRKGAGMPPAAPDDHVKLLQYSLNLVHTRPALIVDGRFGDGTEKAVRDFQTFLHSADPTIVVDGIVGQVTWRGLYFFTHLGR